MKTTYLFALLVSALSFTACVEESDVVIERDFALPEDPVQLPDANLERIDATQLQGVNYSMANIEYRNQAGESTNFSMASCILSVLETECDANDIECLAQIEEAGSSINFGNDIVTDASNNAQNTISFRKIDELTPPSGSFSDAWLMDQVFPIVGGNYPFAVYRSGNSLVLKCSNCPVEYSGQTYTERSIHLTLE